MQQMVVMWLLWRFGEQRLCVDELQSAVKCPQVSQHLPQGQSHSSVMIPPSYPSRSLLIRNKSLIAYFMGMGYCRKSLQVNLY